MKVRCAQEDLSRAMTTVGRATSARATMPILANVLLETTAGGLRVVATDLEVGVRVQIPAQVERGGQVTLPARLLAEIVSHLHAAPVSIRVEEGSSVAEITCQRASFELVGLPAGDFPRLPDSDVERVCALPGPLLRTMIRQTLFAASTDDTRPFLAGVYVTGEGEVVRFVATDGGRLALRTARVRMDRAISAIVPSKTMHELVRLCGAVEGEVEVGMVDNQLAFSAGDVRLFSRLVGGQFPNYQQVIPKEFKQRVRVGTEALYGALRRVAITARDSATVVRLAAQEGVLRLSSSTPEVGRAWEELEAEAFGEPMEVAFNARYLLDALGVVETEQVDLELTGPLSPGALRPVGSEEYVYVVAPVRVYG
ncbi:MAG: DNA polymerase III subunit beta [Armatimonadota bacterium]|nr:DNA polymerase III subunit beta [Armatimonadota bacterium]MDW8155656.1 DNA polymerase III subunit beta [Armatimonadota bacterium]